MIDAFQLKNEPNQLPKPPGPKHDSLHMADGLRHCWCLCAKCFMRTPDGSKGICICRQCPCAASYEASKPMYVPRVKHRREAVTDPRPEHLPESSLCCTLYDIQCICYPGCHCRCCPACPKPPRDY